MLVQIDIGGVMVTFGESQAVAPPEPFYPYLLGVDPIEDTVGDETGAATFKLSLKAKELISLNLRRLTHILDDDGTLLFEGYLNHINYQNEISLTVDP